MKISENQACAVPLYELLERVPVTQRLTIEKHNSTEYIPVGKHCHEAATLLRETVSTLRDAQAKLLDAQTPHKAMCLRLRQCAERHGLEIGRDYIDVVVIRALDEVMAGRKSV